MKIVVTNDFAVMMNMIGENPFLSINVNEGESDDGTHILSAAVFPFGSVFVTNIDIENKEEEKLNIKTLLNNLLIGAHEVDISNVILDMHSLNVDRHYQIMDIVSKEFKDLEMTVYITEHEKQLGEEPDFIDEYSDKIYTAFIDSLSCGATVINLPDIDYFKEKEEMIVDEQFVPKFVQDYLSCFLILGAKDFTPQLYRMVKKEGSKVFFVYEKPFQTFLEEEDDEDTYEDDEDGDIDDDGIEDFLNGLFGGN